MSFRSFGSEPITSLIAQAGAADRLTLLVGAGASMEAGLPSWETLVKRLLRRAATETGLIDRDDASAMKAWEGEAARDGFLGAAAVVDALAGDRRDAWIQEELYQGRGPSTYFPGPISRQIAQLHVSFGQGLRLLTLNYDDLLEQAFREEEEASEPVALATDDHRAPAEAAPIFHLHGYLGRDERPAGQIVLSESDYQQMQQQGSWQEDLFRNALRDSVVLFVGTSLIDPNVIRYLHAVRPDGTARCFAVFVRQGTYSADVPSGIRDARERALRARWEALGVVPVFVDHFVDVAQILYEVRRARLLGDDYQSLPERAGRWVGTIRRDLLGVDEDARFVRAQDRIGRALRSALAAAVSTAGRVEGREFDEKLAMTMWLIDEFGEYLTSWVTTDRLHLDRATVDPVPVDEHARWLAVRSFCRGAPLAESRDVYASRWHFIRGTPLVAETEQYGRIPVGCLTVASMKGRDETMLNAMEDVVEARFNRALIDNVLELLGQPFR